MSKVGDLVTCDCGCDDFIKMTAKHRYRYYPHCRPRHVAQLIESGEIQPIDERPCEVCGATIFIYAEVLSSADKVACGPACGGKLRKSSAEEYYSGDSIIKTFRQDYCRQKGECARYDECLDLGAKGEWPRDRMEECFQKPEFKVPARPAISMRRLSTRYLEPE